MTPRRRLKPHGKARKAAAHPPKSAQFPRAQHTPAHIALPCCRAATKVNSPHKACLHVLSAASSDNEKNRSGSVRLRAGYCKMKLPVATLAYCFAVIGFAETAGAQAPVAIVEEIDSKTAGLEFMDYLRTGQLIRLAAGDRLVIGYFDSCWREVIIGGTVQVGKDDSQVSNGSVERQKVRCDVGKKGGTSKETTGSGAMVFRKMPGAAHAYPTVFALSPIFVGSGVGSLAIERLDRTEARILIPVPAANASCGGFV